MRAVCDAKRDRLITGIHPAAPPRRLSLAACLLLAAALCACDSPTRPGTDTLTLTAELSASRVVAGGSVTITTRLTNIGTSAVTLTFPDGCVIHGEVVARPSGPPVSWQVCAAVITTVVLGPGETRSDQITIPTSAAPATGSEIGAGVYDVIASAPADELPQPLRSAPVLLTVE